MEQRDLYDINRALVCWLSIDEINSLMNENKFFKNHYEEFEILLNWLKEGDTQI